MSITIVRETWKKPLRMANCGAWYTRPWTLGMVSTWDVCTKHPNHKGRHRGKYYTWNRI